jgi:hypothetical protein
MIATGQNRFFRIGCLELDPVLGGPGSRSFTEVRGYGGDPFVGPFPANGGDRVSGLIALYATRHPIRVFP